MLITKEFTLIWNELASMGFTPKMVEEGIIDITVRDTCDELDFAAAVMSFNVYLVKVDTKEKERYYKVNQFTVRVFTAY